MMKKLMALAVLALTFIACDYAEDAFDLKPDIEITWVNPVAYSILAGDTASVAVIEEIHFVPRNSVDSYLKEMYLEYYRTEDTLPFFGPTDPVAVYGKIEGLVNSACCDTFKLLGIPVPLTPAINNLGTNEAARVLIHFVAIDEYSENADTTTVWFGIWKMF
jgi:hypothetical protein